MGVVAHVGHWTTSLIYIVPLVLVAAGLFLSGRRQRASDADPTQPEARSQQDQLQQLAERHLTGAISDEEYDRERERLLG